jgi:hypothetical protein
MYVKYAGEEAVMKVSGNLIKKYDNCKKKAYWNRDDSHSDGRIS